MPTRRTVLRGLAVPALAAGAGCSLLPSEAVAVVLYNGSHETHHLSVSVGNPDAPVFEREVSLRNSSRTVFQRGIPAESRGEILGVRASLASGASTEEPVDLREGVAAVEVAVEPGGDLAVETKRG